MNYKFFRRSNFLTTRAPGRVDFVAASKCAVQNFQADYRRSVPTNIFRVPKPGAAAQSHVAMIHWRAAELGLASCPYGCDLGR